jgi:hypothetical protein
MEPHGLTAVVSREYPPSLFELRRGPSYAYLTANIPPEQKLFDAFIPAFGRRLLRRRIKKTPRSSKQYPARCGPLLKTKGAYRLFSTSSEEPQPSDATLPNFGAISGFTSLFIVHFR